MTSPSRKTARPPAESSATESRNPLTRRRDRRRQRIVEAANQLFEENGGEEAGGYDLTTVEQIAERADISVRTFFRYFKTKADTIYLDLNSAAGDFFAMAEAALAEGASEFDACLDARCEQIRSFVEDPADRERLIRAYRSPLFLERNAVRHAHWRRQLLDMLLARQGSRLTEAQAVAIASICLDLTAAVLERWAVEPGRQAPDKAVHQACAALRPMLAAWSPPRLSPAKRRTT